MRRRREATFHQLLAKDLVLAEYATLREEVFRSYDYAQSIVKFSLATYGAIFAAGLLAAEAASGATSPRTFVGWAALTVFGLVLPGVMCVGTWTWLGELTRAERAGAYLRALERNLRANPTLTDALGFPPLSWETFIHKGRDEKAPTGKSVLPYLGTAGLFGGGTLMAVIFAFMWRTYVWPDPASGFWPAFWIWAPIALFAFHFASSAFSGMRLLALGDVVAKIPD